MWCIEAMRSQKCERLLIVVMLACSLVACRSQPVQPPFSPAVFTPDGSSIVFSASNSETCSLYRAEIAKGLMRRLTESGSGCEFDPAFSADGKRLAFMRAEKNGAPAALLLADANGRNEQVLVPADHDDLQPVFIPDSDQILFLRSAAFEHYSPIAGSRRHKFDVFVVDSTSGKVSQLTHKAFYELSHLSVSGDAKEVLLTVIASEGNEFLIAPVLSPERSTTLQPAVPGSPGTPVVYNAVWLPDSRDILFEAASLPPSGGNFDYNIYRLTIATGAIQRLTQLSGMLDGFSVSADGKRAVLLRSGQYSILDLSTQQLTPVELHSQ